MNLLRYATLISVAFVLISVAQHAFAYERVVFNADTTYATSTFGDTKWIASGDTTVIGGYHIDCKAMGIAEIASTTLSLYTDTSTAAFRLVDLQSGRRSVESYTITNTASPYSFTFSPTIWCKDSTVEFVRSEYATRVVRWSHKGGTGIGADPIPHAWCIGMGSSCSFGGLEGFDPAIIAYGTYATATESGGSSTTTYEFYTATTSPAESIDELTTVILTFALMIVLFLSAYASYNMTYGRSRPT